ncbi:SDR family oxidoreductase [Dechloromonas sp. CZR5]|uniref:SDR family oxidoreductase n=1 Tax=Dechloromonas sp. CZR5 TaxID=2608630 RepID=UPI00123D8D2B|nr:SDR family oxidoreductase [Dechloromonas sp. CZR5]
MSIRQSGLEGKVAIVTGAARGLGAAVAAALVASGVRVMLTDVLVQEGEATAARLPGCAFQKHDVTSESDWQAVIEKTLANLGGLDIIVNNAGVESMSLFADCELSEFKRIQSVNVDGTFLGIKWGIRAMRPNGGAGKGGSIVNLSSVAGLVGVPGLGAYCTAKGGVRLMTKAAAIECARLGYGIRVNSIHPAIIKTQMGIDVVNSCVDIGLAENQQGAEAVMAGLHPMGYGEPSDVANAVCYLASSAAKWVTGAELALDGGLTAC